MDCKEISVFLVTNNPSQPKANSAMKATGFGYKEWNFYHNFTETGKIKKWKW